MEKCNGVSWSIKKKRCAELCYPDSVPSTNTGLYPGVIPGYFLSYFLKIEGPIAIAIPVTECRVSNTGVKGELKSLGNMGAKKDV